MGELIKTRCIVARKINGISINDNEYLLEENGDTKVFDGKECAIEFLKQNGLIDETIEDLRFLNYEKFQNNISEEV